MGEARAADTVGSCCLRHHGIAHFTGDPGCAHARASCLAPPPRRNRGIGASPPPEGLLPALHGGACRACWSTIRERAIRGGDYPGDAWQDGHAGERQTSNEGSRRGWPRVDFPQAHRYEVSGKSVAREFGAGLRRAVATCCRRMGQCCHGVLSKVMSDLVKIANVAAASGLQRTRGSEQAAAVDPRPGGPFRWEALRYTLELASALDASPARVTGWVRSPVEMVARRSVGMALRPTPHRTSRGGWITPERTRTDLSPAEAEVSVVVGQFFASFSRGA